ncbi:MAG TPA: hypothetical protein VGS10_14745 [Terracidiphilus sp.]|nr:hypothetical protein [Terracidiphilus sp.]
MDERTMNFVNQLIEKTQQGKLSWSTGFEDGQFKTLLPGGKFAFVVQVKGNERRFSMLDDNQEPILQETVTQGEVTTEPASDKDHLYDAIGTLQELVRSRALKVNEKLITAERMLAEI